MADFYGDRMCSATTSVGTGALTLSPADGPFAPITQVATGGSKFHYTIEHENGAEWEVGYGSVDGSGILSRLDVYSSSAAGSAVDFSAGAKRVSITLPASVIANLVKPLAAGGYPGPGAPSYLFTTNATPAAFPEFTDVGYVDGLSKSAMLEYTLFASKSGDTSSLKVWRITTCRGISTPYYFGKAITVLAESGAPSWAVDADTLGRVVVTGEASATINWRLFVRLLGYF